MAKENIRYDRTTQHGSVANGSYAGLYNYAIQLQTARGQMLAMLGTLDKSDPASYAEIQSLYNVVDGTGQPSNSEAKRFFEKTDELYSVMFSNQSIIPFDTIRQAHDQLT